MKFRVEWDIPDTFISRHPDMSEALFIANVLQDTGYTIKTRGLDWQEQWVSPSGITVKFTRIIS